MEELFPYVKFYKIASYELLWDALLRECAKTGKPVVLSTGMSTSVEVKEAIRVLREGGCEDLTLLHCVSGFPAIPEECNLKAIEGMRQEYGCPVGWSDHSVSPAVIYRAIHHWDASMIEFHLDLDKEGREFKIGHCWLPEEIGEVIKNVERGIHCDGSGEKKPAPSENEEKKWRADPSDGLRPLVPSRYVWRDDTAGRAEGFP